MKNIYLYIQNIYIYIYKLLATSFKIAFPEGFQKDCYALARVAMGGGAI